MVVEFDDGVRTLIYDEGAALPKIGAQAISAIPTAINAPAQSLTLPTGSDDEDSAIVFVSRNAEVDVGGNVDIFGTTGRELSGFRPVR